MIKHIKSVPEKITKLRMETHPFSNKSLEKKMAYLFGMVLVSIIDNELHEKERSYLAVLMNTLGISINEIDKIKESVMIDDPNTVDDIASSLSLRSLGDKYYFMLEAIVVAHQDDFIHRSEIQIIEDFFRLFKMNKIQRKKIFEIHEHLKKKDFSKVLRWAAKINIKIEPFIEYFSKTSFRVKLYENLSNTNLDTRVAGILKKNKIHLIGDVLKKQKKISQIPGIGETYMHKIELMLKENGMSWDTDISGYPDKDFFTMLNPGKICSKRT